jgi:FkbM family methyltransferase
MSQVTEDLSLLPHPVKLLDGIRSLRQKAKFYNQMEEVFIRQVYGWLYRRIVPNTVVIDIGSFIGDTAIYFAMNPNVKKVFAYEPNPASYKICRENVEKCPLKNVVLSNHAVSNQEGPIEITHNYPTGYNKTVRAVNETDIHAVSINSILKPLKGQRIVIKCDAEGAENEIFENNTNLNDVYAIMMEYHNGAIELKQTLKKKGYRVAVTSRRDMGYLTAWR